MGVLEFFGTLIRNDITASSIQSDFSQKTAINHLFIDFNSIIHVSSQKVVSDINTFMSNILKNLYESRGINTVVFDELFRKYRMEDIQNKITPNTDPLDVILYFNEHFNDDYVDKLIITMVINTLLSIVRTFCFNKSINTLMIAIDGVPSKGKMVEQKQRRYLGAITEEYKKRIFRKYRSYLKDQPNYQYLATKNAIKGNRNKITPGTAFMHKLVNYLNSDKIQNKLKTNRPSLEIIISDMYEVGEGEKKIVNYINYYLPNTNDSIMVYSPDADVILLCMLLPVKNVYMLRHNNQTSATSGKNIYDLIDINMLKSNIGYYINNNPDFSQENFDIDRINYDIVCISTLFGNDFVPKIETFNVKKGFQNVLDAYLKTLLNLKNKGYYLVKLPSENIQARNKFSLGGEFKLNFTFLKKILGELIPDENDFIKHNNLYAQYITLGQIKLVFNYMEINSENIVSTVNNFKMEYGNLQNAIKNKGNLYHYETDDQFMLSLKKAAVVIMDDKCINTSYLTNKQMIRLLIDYWKKYRSFPWLNINLNVWSHSINDFRHTKVVKDKRMNEYQKEIYSFEQMLDKYYYKFNAEPLNLGKNGIDDFYSEYFGVELYDSNGDLTPNANLVMHDYIEGILWVFNYYFNDTSYVNTWCYAHERAPLIRHLLQFLESIDHSYFNEIYNGLDKYNVNNITKYFNPIEQLIYVSPMTAENLLLLPLNYRNYIESDDLDPFLRNYFVDIYDLTKKLWRQKVSDEIDCHSVPFFNKCFILSLSKPTAKDDELFLRAIRKVKPTDVSKRRSKSEEPEY